MVHFASWAIWVVVAFYLYFATEIRWYGKRIAILKDSYKWHIYRLRYVRCGSHPWQSTYIPYNARTYYMPRGPGKS